MTNTVKRKIQVAVVHCDQSKQKKLLLLKLIPERGGHWQNITGHVEADETLFDAAKRELIEETSISPALTQIVDAKFSFEFLDRFNMQRVEHGFIAWVETDEVKIDTREHTEYKWLPIKEITSDHLGFETHWELVKLIMERE